MKLGTLAAMWRYPTKSLRPETLRETIVTDGGIPGDRERALIVQDGHVRLGKSYRGKENDRLHTVTDTDEALELAAKRGVTLEVISDGADAHYFDAAPISIIVDRWLDDLSTFVGYRVAPVRFRPNFFIETPETFAFEEAALIDRELKLGDVALLVRKSIGRCVTPTYDPSGGKSDPEILRYIALNRDNQMGIYCDVLRAGTVRIGDSLELVER